MAVPRSYVRFAALGDSVTMAWATALRIGPAAGRASWARPSPATTTSPSATSRTRAPRPPIYEARLHPSELGHRALAHEFATLLDQHGLAFEPPALELDGDPITRLSELRTIVVDGVPWVARRVRDLGPAFGRKALQTALHGSQASPGQGTYQFAPR